MEFDGEEEMKASGVLPRNFKVEIPNEITAGYRTSAKWT